MDTIVEDYVDRAATSIKQAEDCLNGGDWPTSILRSAEAVELTLEAVIRLVGGTYDRKHDVSDKLAHHLPDFPPWFKYKIPRFGLLSRTLTSLSFYAKYGDEMLRASPKALFSESEANAYLNSASEVLNACLRLQREKESNLGIAGEQK